MSIPESQTSIPPDNSIRFRSLSFFVEALLVLGVILAHAGWAVPSTNESHYLTKAKHFWDRSALGNDFFLKSKDAHWVFFASFGWLARFFSLATTTWIVRLVTWSVLAASWTRLSRAVVNRRFFAVLSMAVFVATQKRLTWSIEWVVDAVEAKVMAYAFLFFALADVLENRWRRCWIFFGLATAWHPVVGGWATLAAGAYLILFVPFTARSKNLLPKRIWLGMLIGGVIGLVGVIPPLRINSGADPAVIQQAHEIQVYKRLPHHLYPPGFRPGKLENHLLMLAAWIGFGGLSLRLLPAWRLQTYVLVTFGITLAGILLWLLNPDGSPEQAQWLQFYFYRLFDVMVAVGMSMGLIAFLSTLDARSLTCWIAMLVVALSVNFIERGRLIWGGIPGQFKLGGDDDAENRARFESWKDLCRWAREETPTDATFVAPVKCQTFTWYAERGKYVSWKDAPQDAAGLVEWHRRMHLIHKATTLDERRDNLHERSAGEWRRIAAQEKIDYLIYFNDPERAIALPIAYKNEHFVAYSLRSP